MDGARSTLRAVGVVSLVLAVLGLVVWWWFFSTWRVAARTHDEALERWEAKEPAAYSFVYRHCNGMCGSCPIHVTVRDGVVADATRGPDICSGEPEGLTVEDLFEVASRAPSYPWGESYETEYDPEWGHPTLVTTTCGADTSDCGSSWVVADFQVLERK